MATDTNPETTRESQPEVVVRHPVGDEDTVCESVATAVATVEGCSVLDLDPLEGTVDTDALNSLFPSGAPDDRSRFTFRYCGYTVVVTGTEIAVLSDP